MNSKTLDAASEVQSVEMSRVPDRAHTVNLFARMAVRHGDFSPIVWFGQKRERIMDCKHVKWATAVHVAAHSDEVLSSHPKWTGLAVVLTMGRVLIVRYTTHRAHYTLGSEIITMPDGSLEVEPTKATVVQRPVMKQMLN